jgi:hypothetical protein
MRAARDHAGVVAYRIRRIAASTGASYAVALTLARSHTVTERENAVRSLGQTD